MIGSEGTIGPVRAVDVFHVALALAHLAIGYGLAEHQSRYFNRYFFRMTGRIYLGPMVTCLVFVMILISNTVIYLPL